MSKTVKKTHKISTLAQRRAAVKTVFALINQCKKVSDYQLMKRYHTTRMSQRLQASGYITPVENEPGYFWLTKEASALNIGNPEDLEGIVNNIFQLKSKRDRGPVQTEINLDPGDMVPVNETVVKKMENVKIEGQTFIEHSTDGQHWKTIVNPMTGEALGGTGFVVYEDPARTALVKKIKKGLEMVERYEITNVAEYLADFIRE